MQILIEIIFFLIVGATGIGAYLKRATTTVKDGVRKKLQEREVKKQAPHYPLSRYADQFTFEQRKCLFGILIPLAECDLYVTTEAQQKKEADLINILSIMFRIDISKMMGFLQLYDQKYILKTLSSNSTVLGISIFIISQLAMEDGPVNDNESDFIYRILGILNMTPEMYVKTANEWGQKLDLESRKANV